MSDVLSIHLDAQQCEFTVGEATYVVPVGSALLARSVGGDPPRPDDLTNAIGLVVDHLDDVTRELPDVVMVTRVEMSGPGLSVVADVEVGASTPLPYRLARDAAEEVFRTLATETATERALNPGLPAPMVHDVLGLTVAVVAVLRGLDLDHLWVVA